MLYSVAHGIFWAQVGIIAAVALAGGWYGLGRVAANRRHAHQYSLFSWASRAH
jgi:hypothetical protein